MRARCLVTALNDHVTSTFDVSRRSTDATSFLGSQQPSMLCMDSEPGIVEATTAQGRAHMGGVDGVEAAHQAAQLRDQLPGERVAHKFQGGPVPPQVCQRPAVRGVQRQERL